MRKTPRGNVSGRERIQNLIIFVRLSQAREDEALKENGLRARAARAPSHRGRQAACDVRPEMCVVPLVGSLEGLTGSIPHLNVKGLSLPAAPEPPTGGQTSQTGITGFVSTAADASPTHQHTPTSISGREHRENSRICNICSITSLILGENEQCLKPREIIWSVTVCSMS